MFQIVLASPPHRDDLVAQMHIEHDGGVAIPAEVFRADGRLTVAVYPVQGGDPWEFPLGEFIQAMGQAIERLGA